jgi:very-short-patch-repair endonuclease
LKVTGLNGKEYIWNLSSYDVFNDDKRKRSKYHLRARNLLREIYNSYRILEEVKLPGSTELHRRSVLYLDFYIPSIKIAIEVHGEQHYKFNPFFHKSMADFVKSKARDEDKISWCELNGIKVIILKYSESEDEWRERIKSQR